MGLFDAFSRGGKYFGKSIEPRCEYCEFGKRAKDGDKVLCSRKGLVNSGDHCPKFTYSPLKRIPVKQMKMVGFLEGDYDEKNYDEEESVAQKDTKASAKKDEPKAAPVSESVQESAPATVAAVSDDLAALAAAADAVPAADDLAALAAAADAASATDDLTALAAAADAAEDNADASALSAM